MPPFGQGFVSFGSQMITRLFMFVQVDAAWQVELLTVATPPVPPFTSAPQQTVFGFPCAMQSATSSQARFTPVHVAPTAVHV
jgi:hypothetical protein